jgi:hypothetical protein
MVLDKREVDRLPATLKRSPAKAQADKANHRASATAVHQP